MMLILPHECLFVRMTNIMKFFACTTVVCIVVLVVSALLTTHSRALKRDFSEVAASSRLHVLSMTSQAENNRSTQRPEQPFSKSTISENLQLERQRRRKKHILEVCLKFNSSGQLLSINKTLTPSHFQSIFVDDNHRLLYCSVPKVACTNWKRILLILTGKMNITKMEDLISNNVHYDLARTYLRRLNNYTMEEIQHRLHEYYKFLFVREPFERLLSAYFDKIVVTKGNEIFKRRIVKKYRKNPRNEPLLGGYDVTFDEFVAYLLDPKTTEQMPFNEHWLQYHELCHPCLVNYDLIGKYETLQEDADLALRQVGVRGLVQFPKSSPRQTRTSDLVAQNFANISAADIHRLWKIYSGDFELFEYPYPNVKKDLET